MRAILCGLGLIACMCVEIEAVQELSKSTYNQVVTSSKYVVVDVYADWCNPCKRLAPILQTLSHQYENVYTFAKLNATEENQELVTSMGVKSLPTLILYKDGKEVLRKTGFMDKGALIALFEGTFNS